jgi:hypothetical protein
MIIGCPWPDNGQVPGGACKLPKLALVVPEKRLPPPLRMAAPADTQTIRRRFQPEPRVLVGANVSPSTRDAAWQGS